MAQAPGPHALWLVRHGESLGNLGMIRLVYDRFGVRWQEDGDDIIVPADQELTIQEGLGGRVHRVGI